MPNARGVTPIPKIQIIGPLCFFFKIVITTSAPIVIPCVPVAGVVIGIPSKIYALMVPGTQTQRNGSGANEKRPSVYAKYKKRLKKPVKMKLQLSRPARRKRQQPSFVKNKNNVTLSQPHPILISSVA
jgi:hypothetical protein